MQSISCLVSHEFFKGAQKRPGSGHTNGTKIHDPKLCDTHPDRPAAWYPVLSYLARGRGILVFEVPFNTWGFAQGAYAITIDSPHLQTVGIN